LGGNIMGYATLDEVKNNINISSLGGVRDNVLEGLIEAATRSINQYCNRPDGFLVGDTAEARYWAGSGKPYQTIHECTSITEVAVKESATETTFTAWTTPTTNFSADGDWIAYAGEHESPEFNRLPYTGIMIDPTGDEALFTSGRFTARGGFRPSHGISRDIPTVRVTAFWGYATTVPDQVREATIVQVSRWYMRGKSGWADALINSETGQLVFRKAIDPDVKAMLWRLIMPEIG
jgi:hypothetical protein